jgi:hypothetical protein
MVYLNELFCTNIHSKNQSGYFSVKNILFSDEKYQLLNLLSRLWPEASEQGKR